MNAMQTQARGLPPDGSPPCLLRGHRRIIFWLLVLIASGLLVSGCAAPPRPASQQRPTTVVHVVQRGETLFRISQAYGMTVARLTEANRLDPAAPLQVGQRLIIPGAVTVKAVE